MKRTYYIRPAGTEAWVETPARTVKYLRAKGYEVTVDKKEYAVFIEVTPKP